MLSIFLDNGVPSSEINTILYEHNDIRNKIARGQLAGQPKGKGFKTMVSFINTNGKIIQLSYLGYFVFLFIIFNRP